uniref:Uncharacterized protein n=1 Tax=Salix viminalis TaxID=40686 RepID=A0A6N2N5K7_SALVM
MMVKFVEDSVTPREDLYVNVKEDLQKRGMLPLGITENFNDEEFIKMMFIDGCFILQFMHCLNNESLEMSDRQIFDVKRDLLLLENQLPFAVLDSLRKQSRGHGLNYSVKNLKKMGILFWPRWTPGSITDVKFKSSVLSGIVDIPPIIIDESTESLLLNLVAYESAAALDQRLWVSSYILFMDSLIDDAEDVKEMRSNGIIINYLGADQNVTISSWRTEEERKKVEEEISIRGGFRRDRRTPLVSVEELVEVMVAEVVRKKKMLQWRRRKRRLMQRFLSPTRQWMGEGGFLPPFTMSVR